MIEPNTDILTLIFVSLVVILPITLHIMFGESRDIDTEKTYCEEDQ